MKISNVKKCFFSALIILFVFMLARADAAGDPVAIIVNNNNTMSNITNTMIKRIYRNDLIKWPSGIPIILYDLDVSDPVRETFSSNILGRKAERIAEEWAHKKITNTALNPPNTLKSQRLIIRRVSMQKGAIGYVSLSRAKDRADVRVLAVLD